MKRYKFYRIVREKDKLEFVESGTAWFEDANGTVFSTDDAVLSKLLSNPITVNVGGIKPYTLRPEESRFLPEAASELFDEGYIGRSVDA